MSPGRPCARPGCLRAVRSPDGRVRYCSFCRPDKRGKRAAERAELARAARAMVEAGRAVLRSLGVSE